MSAPEIRHHSSDDMGGPEFEGIYEPTAVVLRPDATVDVYGYVAVIDQRPQKTNVRQFLDLSTAHLPTDIMNAPLDSLDDVIAYYHPHGAVLWVPPAEDLDGWSKAPAEVQTIWYYARSLDCDYVIFDADGPKDDKLPIWEWK